MKIGEVCLLTGDVVRLANFYKKVLLDVENDCQDTVHQFILKDETTLTVHNDGTERTGNSHHICIAFTVGDVDAEYERLQALGVEIINPPTVRPWGAKNMMFLDPDGNHVYFRSIPE
ncbi:MAG: VOC family protein [Oscillospiraceae bacterium]|nr:VOC family protein [Oscillospiraceae bacterium]